jgi:hypothetical protein
VFQELRLRTYLDVKSAGASVFTGMGMRGFIAVISSVQGDTCDGYSLTRRYTDSETRYAKAPRHMCQGEFNGGRVEVGWWVSSVVVRVKLDHRS